MLTTLINTAIYIPAFPRVQGPSLVASDHHIRNQAMATRAGPGLFFTTINIILCFTLTLLLPCCSAEPYEDRQALLDFLRNLPHSRPINWNTSLPACTNWTGVTCNRDQTHVIALRLPGVGFIGPLPSNTLSRLSGLQVLSLRSNKISGSFPTADLLRLHNLTSLHLQSNRLSGPLPSDFSSPWEGKILSVLNLSNNRLSGTIPSSIGTLARLTALDLSRNFLSGEVPPQLDIPSLKYLNLSNNNLQGPLPHSLQLKFPASSFSGNNISIQNYPPPSASHPPPPPAASVHHNKKKLSQTAILGIILSVCTLAFVLAMITMLVFCSHKRGYAAQDLTAAKSVKHAPKPSSSSRKRPVLRAESPEESSRITFFEGSNLAFDLEDLLRASAEVLGKGTFGTTYKAALEELVTVVVKRLKDVSVGRKEFEQQIKAVGEIRHDNVAALRAYYYSRDEKLIVYDYFSHGSACTLLHGKRGDNKTHLDWEARLRIAIGAARGLAHIHEVSNGKLVHGNIKSSNILLNNTQQFGCVSDLGLATIVTPTAPPVIRSAGYRAPELADQRKGPSQASDVYSFGVFLLELLTGKSPLEEGMNLVKWVNSVVREEWTAEVFDVELLRYPNMEEEMVQMLQVGMGCSMRMPEQRPKMGEVMRMVEEIRRDGSRSDGSSTPNTNSHVVEIGSTSAFAGSQ